MLSVPRPHLAIKEPQQKDSFPVDEQNYSLRAANGMASSKSKVCVIAVDLKKGAVLNEMLSPVLPLFYNINYFYGIITSV
jgi:hypothetical protein